MLGERLRQEQAPRGLADVRERPMNHPVLGDEQEL